MTEQPLWVFGYGSLMWRPGFQYSTRQIARLTGYARSFCMWSIHYRGTHEQPGLVLALDEDETASCLGLGFEVSPDHRQEALEYLRARELISSAYLEAELPMELDDGRVVHAVTFVINRENNQYCGGLELQEQARVIANARGEMGSNVEYLQNTAAHLRELGIHDPEMEWLVERVAELTGS
ncbi:gamma-glutamylcyclotransferase [Falsihalocynthiibacter sp. SS001]|uniref:gamma-glutamylcyclotransferase n=1 Tax=Falsihalocynthiibacter sp. SS001 TaxID=3349698 RepID=UPI0036D42699